MGVRLAIDDFGTGYSSLSYLRHFPITTLKIDQSFVRGLPDVREDVALVRSIIALADGLGLEVVAEGIETEQQAAFLKEFRGLIGQGYLFNRPLPFEQLIKALS
jgi:EAL domain-containing protein (putative c-di-GMP-specific phosphodiesterase class I)